MLVLDRKIGDAIEIYNAKPEDNIIVKVLNRKGQSISLGIDAPKHVTVHRGEVRRLVEGEL